MTAIAVIGSRKAFCDPARDSRESRSYRLMVTLTVLPLAVFVVFSVFRSIKLNWTIPLWLGILPYMAAFVLPDPGRRLPVWAVRPWRVTIAVILLVYATAFHYLALGIPGLPMAAGLRGLGTGMASVAEQVDEHVQELCEKTGVEPMTVCLDTDRLAGWLAFYRLRLGDSGESSPVLQTTGNQLLGGESGMYRSWHPVEGLRGRVIEVVGYSEREVDDARAQFGARALTPVEPLGVSKHGVEFARFWCQGMQTLP